MVYTADHRKSPTPFDSASIGRPRVSDAIGASLRQVFVVQRQTHAFDDLIRTLDRMTARH